MVGVVDNDNRMTFRKVKIVRDDGNMVQLGSGVSPGDRVALNISNQIADGDTVEVHEPMDGLAHVQKPERELSEIGLTSTFCWARWPVFFLPPVRSAQIIIHRS